MTKPTPELREAATELFKKAPALVQMAMLTKLSSAVSRNAANPIAISDIFTASVKAEEAGDDAMPIGILATIHAVYEEFKPETMKGFDVYIDGRIERFDHLNDAEYYARCNADRVARASSVDHYFFDKDVGAASVKAEEAAEAGKPISVPADARRIDFGPDAKHFAYFNSATSELFVGMTGEGVVDEKTLIEVLAHVNPYYLKTIYVRSFASISPTSSAAADKASIDVFAKDFGKFDLVERDFVVPACLPKGVSTDTILPTTPVSNTRYHEHDGKLYLIRDTVYGARIQCQYAVKGRGTAVDWKDCREGVDFAEIEPFAILPVDDAKVRSVALMTLRDAMRDEYVPAATRADIAKYVIESRIG